MSSFGSPTPLDVNGVLLEQLGTYLIESLTRKRLPTSQHFDQQCRQHKLLTERSRIKRSRPRSHLFRSQISRRSEQSVPQRLAEAKRPQLDVNRTATPGLVRLAQKRMRSGNSSP